MIKRKKLKKIIVLSSLLFSFVGLSSFYLFQMVKMSEIAYTIGKNTAIVKNLEKETAELKLDISKQKNLKNAEEKIIDQGFKKVSSSSINYIVIPEISLAKN